jgi:hypothetical protein
VWTWFVSEVWPNLVASVIYDTPAFLVSHLLLRRHITRRTAPQNTTEAKR